MALTIRPITRTGKLIIEDERGKIVGNGRAVVSKSHLGYITLTLNKTKNWAFVNMMVVRVPADWVLELRDLPEPEELR